MAGVYISESSDCGRSVGNPKVGFGSRVDLGVSRTSAGLSILLVTSK